MTTLLVFAAWCLLLVLAWPVAIVALVLAPFVAVFALVVGWLLMLPFRLIGITVDALFALLHALFLLPARLLGHRGR